MKSLRRRDSSLHTSVSQLRTSRGTCCEHRETLTRGGSSFSFRTLVLVLVLDLTRALGGTSGLDDMKEERGLWWIAPGGVLVSRGRSFMASCAF